MIEKDIRREISERWIQAVDYLIQLGELKSYRDLEEKTGIQNQRITLIKAYLRNPETNRASFAHIDYIYHLAEKFNVSLEWMYFGRGSLIENKELSLVADASVQYQTPMMQMQQKIDSLSKIVEQLVQDKK